MKALLIEPTPHSDSEQDLIHTIADKCMDLNRDQLLIVLSDLNLIEHNGDNSDNLQIIRLNRQVKREKKKFRYWLEKSEELASQLKETELQNRILKYQLSTAKEALDDAVKEFFSKGK